MLSARLQVEGQTKTRGEELFDRDVRASEFERLDRATRLERLRGELDRARVQEADLSAQLQEALSTLAAMEQDLLAARARKVEIDSELTVVRRLEKELTTREQRMAELRVAHDALGAEIASLETSDTELRQQWAARRIAIVQRAAAMAAALQALGELGVADGGGADGGAGPKDPSGGGAADPGKKPPAGKQPSGEKPK